MITQFKRIVYLIWLFSLPGFPIFSQNYSSLNNYTGDWETPSSWNPVWPVPQTIISGNDITINGYIILNGSLSFTGNGSLLTVNDTLVIRGDFLLGNNNDILINDNGILIIQGNFTMNNQTVVTANGYLIITGDFTKNSALGSLTSNDNPVKVFIGGKISPAGLTAANAAFPALNCTSPVTARHPYSNCSYGNMTDLMNDPIYPFFQSTLCNVTTPVITASGPVTFCFGENVTLTSSPGAKYLWSSGETTSSINVTESGSFTVKIADNSGCRSGASLATVVTVNEKPVADAGPDQVLNYIFETQMGALLAASETGEWSLISGNGHINDIHSPTTIITDLSVGENLFLWKVRIGSCEDTSKVKIIVNDLFVPSVITPDGDGKNDYFKIGEFVGKVELNIINRWGNLEYKNTHYLNDWNGLNNDSQELPDDTYFYILKFENGEIRKGSVLIKR
jgi:gliding motility-associated-like protein